MNEFLYHNGTVIQVSSQLWMFLISTPHKNRTFTVQLAVTTNTKETVLQQMCCLDPRGVPIGPIVRGVIACPILGRWWDVTTQVATQSVHWQASYGISNIFQQRPSAILNFQNFNIWSRDCHYCPNLLLYTKFDQNWFSVRPSYAHNCWMSSAPLLGNGRYHGNRNMADMSGTWWDASCIPVGSLVGELWHFEYFQHGGRPPFWILKILIFDQCLSLWS